MPIWDIYRQGSLFSYLPPFRCTVKYWGFLFLPVFVALNFDSSESPKPLVKRCPCPWSCSPTTSTFFWLVNQNWKLMPVFCLTGKKRAKQTRQDRTSHMPLRKASRKLLEQYHRLSCLCRWLSTSESGNGLPKCLLHRGRVRGGPQKTQNNTFGKHIVETASTCCGPRCSGLCLPHLFHVGEPSQDVFFSRGQCDKNGTSK